MLKRLVRGGAMALAAAAAIGAGAAASASALSIQPPGTAFTGTGTEPAVFTTNGGSGPIVRCTTTTFTGTTANPATDRVDVAPSYTGGGTRASLCTTNIGGGTRDATVSTPGTWTLRVIGGTLPNYTGTVTINNAVTITMAGLTCQIIIAANTTVNGTGVNAAGSPPPGTYINPRGSSISVPFATSGTCLGVDRTRPAVYTGEVYAPNVYVGP